MHVYTRPGMDSDMGKGRRSSRFPALEVTLQRISGPTLVGSYTHIRAIRTMVCDRWAKSWDEQPKSWQGVASDAAAPLPPSGSTAGGTFENIPSGAPSLHFHHPSLSPHSLCWCRVLPLLAYPSSRWQCQDFLLDPELQKAPCLTSAHKQSIYWAKDPDSPAPHFHHASHCSALHSLLTRYCSIVLMHSPLGGRS